MRRRDFIGAIAGASGWPLAVRAQQDRKVHRIGFLENDPSIPMQTAGKAFLEALREHGLVEDENIVIERRFAQGASSRSSELAAELAKLDLSLIVASGQNNIAALRQAAVSIPVVMLNVFDPVGIGLADSLASPGRNFTGLTSPLSLRMLGKRLQLLKDVFPQISRLAVLRMPNFATDQAQWNWLERAAPAFNVRLIPVSMNEPADLEPAFGVIRREHPDGLFASDSPLALMLRKQIIDLVAGRRFPAIYPFTEVVEAGGLMSYGASRADLFRQAATYVVKILEGAKPAALPIEQPTKFELAVNVTTAKTLHLKIPGTLLALADKIIE